MQWPDVNLQPAVRAKFGYIAIRHRKSKNAKRNLSLTSRAAEMLQARKAGSKSTWVFAGDMPEAAILGTSLDHQHDHVRLALELTKDFVIHSLRHTRLTRLGEAGAEAFTIMKIAGHSSVTVSQRYVHPTPEGMERALERLEDLNAAKFEPAEAGVKREAAEGSRAATFSATVTKQRQSKSLQIAEFKRKGP